MSKKTAQTKGVNLTLVGTYREKQLAWIKRNGLCNYPLRSGRVSGSVAADSQFAPHVRELWLYADAKGRRHAFAVTGFVGVQTRAEFLAANPTYPKARTAHAEKYLVFRTEYLKYGPRLDDTLVQVRLADFTSPRVAKVKKAIEQYGKDGEIAPLAAYLPADLGKLPKKRLRVCEEAVQMDFLCVVDAQESRQIRDKYIKSSAERLTCLDFFAGSGLVSSGLANDFRTVWANDISMKKAQVFNANHDKNVLQVCSIENVCGSNLPDVDLSWGSFPCQDLSLAGDMNGLYAKRSGLFWQWLRVMDEMKIRPSVVVAENVVGLVSAKGGEYYVAVHNALQKRGYRVGAVLLDAAYWLPQSRKRIFVVGVLNDVDVSGLVSDLPTWCHPAPIIKVAKKVSSWTWWNMPRPESKPISLDEVIDFSIPCDSGMDRDGKLALIDPKSIEKAKNMSRLRCRAFTGYRRTRNHKQVLEIRTDGVAGCLRTPGGGSSRQIVIIADKGSLNTRLLTVREAARLMGAPDSYRIPGSYNEGYTAMGDAVAVPVVSYLSQLLLAPLAHRAKKRKM